MTTQPSITQPQVSVSPKRGAEGWNSRLWRWDNNYHSGLGGAKEEAGEGPGSLETIYVRAC